MKRRRMCEWPTCRKRAVHPHSRLSGRIEWLCLKHLNAAIKQRQADLKAVVSPG